MPHSSTQTVAGWSRNQIAGWELGIRKGVVNSLLVISENIGAYLRTPALKTEKFSKKIGRFSKTRKWIY